MGLSEGLDPNKKKLKSLKIIFIVFLVIDLLVIADLFYDYLNGMAISHLIFDQLLALFFTVALALLFPAFLKEYKVLNKQFLDKTQELFLTKKEKEKLKQGISLELERKYRDWSLSPSESEICTLLVKGLSIDEIAKIRGTEGSTIRQQARSIYRKSKLKGRRELSAYFLEDFLF